MASTTEVKAMKKELKSLKENELRASVLMVACLDLIKSQYSSIKSYVDDGNANDLFDEMYFSDVANILQKVKAYLPEGMAADRFEGVI